MFFLQYMNVFPAETFLLVESTDEDNFSVVSSSRVRDSGDIDATCLCGGEQVIIAVDAGRQSKRTTVPKSGN